MRVVVMGHFGTRALTWAALSCVLVLGCRPERPERDAATPDKIEAGVSSAGRSSAESVKVASDELTVTPACYGASGLPSLAPWPAVGLCQTHRGQSPTIGAQTNARAW